MAAALLVAATIDPRWIGASGPAGIQAVTALAHLVGYAAFGAAVVATLGREWRWAAVAVAAGYGAGIELLQVGLAYRTGSLVDVAVNCAGAALGVVAWGAVSRSRSSTEVED
jgi:VanZ family protein